jgi:very-short-patch-repair endonuclease
MIIHNIQPLKLRRKELRAAMTPAEIRLWQALKHSQLDHLKFRRQPSIGPFIADFYCPAAKRVIELDGSVHDSETAQQQDAERTAYWSAWDCGWCGLKIVRSWRIWRAFCAKLSDRRGRKRSNHPGAARHPSLSKEGKFCNILQCVGELNGLIGDFPDVTTP